MDRGVAILFILLQTLFMPANMKTIFSNSKRRFKVNVNRRAVRLIPITAEPQRVLESLYLRDRHGKTKTPEYLRTGMPMPRNIFNIYEPTYAYESTPSTHNKDKMTENHNSENKNIEDRLYESRETEQQPEMVEAATPYTILLPAEDEKDTCLWRVQQPQKPQKTDLNARVTMKKVQPYDLQSDMGSWIHNTWQSIKKRYWIAFEKVKRKIHNMMDGIESIATPQESTQTTNETDANKIKSDISTIEADKNKNEGNTITSKKDHDNKNKDNTTANKADESKNKRNTITSEEAHDNKNKSNTTANEAHDNKNKRNAITSEADENENKSSTTTSEDHKNDTNANKTAGEEARDNKNKCNNRTGINQNFNRRGAFRQTKPRKSQRRFRLPFLH